MWSPGLGVDVLTIQISNRVLLLFQLCEHFHLKLIRLKTIFQDRTFMRWGTCLVWVTSSWQTRTYWHVDSDQFASSDLWFRCAWTAKTGALRGFGDLGRMAIYFQGAGEYL